MISLNYHVLEPPRRCVTQPHLAGVAGYDISPPAKKILLLLLLSLQKPPWVCWSLSARGTQLRLSELTWILPAWQMCASLAGSEWGQCDSFTVTKDHWRVGESAFFVPDHATSVIIVFCQGLAWLYRCKVSLLCIFCLYPFRFRNELSA